MAMNRRRFLQAAGALAAGATAGLPLARAQDQKLRFADMHTHIGMYRDTQNVHEAMTKNGVLLISRKIVGDGAVIQRVPGKGLQMYRQPKPGELAQRYEATLQRLNAQHKVDNLFAVTSAETLARALRGSDPAVVIGVEGGDFLEGDLQRLESSAAAGYRASATSALPRIGIRRHFNRAPATRRAHAVWQGRAARLQPFGHAGGCRALHVGRH